jgi:hypothetical protein
MADTIQIAVTGEAALRARIQGAPERLMPILVRNLNTVHTQLQRHIVSDKLSGQVLKSHTGNLKRAILQEPAEVEGNTVTASVGLGSEAKYGLAHEFGASIPERTPKNARALHWIGADGADVFAMRARAFTLPERSFLRTGFAEFQPNIIEAIRSALQEALG